jgi:hypothetical protein
MLEDGEAGGGGHSLVTSRSPVCGQPGREKGRGGAAGRRAAQGRAPGPRRPAVGAGPDSGPARTMGFKVCSGALPPARAGRQLGSSRRSPPGRGRAPSRGAAARSAGSAVRRDAGGTRVRAPPVRAAACCACCATGGCFKGQAWRGTWGGGARGRQGARQGAGNAARGHGFLLWSAAPGGEGPRRGRQPSSSAGRQGRQGAPGRTGARPNRMLIHLPLVAAVFLKRARRGCCWAL